MGDMVKWNGWNLYLEVKNNNHKEHLPKWIFSYDNIVNRSTVFALFYLMFGGASQLPIDSIFPHNEPEGKTEEEVYGSNI